MLTLIAASFAMSVITRQELAQKGIKVPNAIAKQHNAYVRCQDDHFDVRNARDPKSFAAEVEKSIAACKEQKAALIAEAKGILVSSLDYRDPAKRQDAIAQSFDGYDALRREMAAAAQPR